MITDTTLEGRARSADFARAANRKTLEMEGAVARLRAIVIALNVCVYFLFLYGHTPRAPLAFVVIAVAVPYAFWSLGTRPYERYPLLRFGLATLVCDMGLITLWILATGGPRSEFWIIYAVSAVSAGMRYDFARSVMVGISESIVYVIVMSFYGGLSLASSVIRPGYIIIASIAAGFLSRQEALSRQERVEAERLAGEHAAMLARERETVDALRSLDEMKTTFVSAVSHEVRTPLTSVLGFAKTLQRSVEYLSADERDDMLERLVRNAERLDRILVDVLELSSFAHGNTTIERARIKVGDVIRRVLDETIAHGRSFDVRIDAGDAYVDGPKVERIVDNLVRNAVKYSPGQEPITVRTWRNDQGLMIAVEDRGPGVPDEFKTSIFVVFRQGPSTVTYAPGTGVGLALVEKLAKLHGGTAWVEDREGGGASFRVLIPDHVDAEPIIDAHRPVMPNIA